MRRNRGLDKSEKEKRKFARALYCLPCLPALSLSRVENIVFSHILDVFRQWWRIVLHNQSFALVFFHVWPTCLSKLSLFSPSFTFILKNISKRIVYDSSLMWGWIRTYYSHIWGWLRYTQIGEKGCTTKGERGSSQYFKTLLADLGFVAPEGTTSEDADDRVLTVGLPRWLPQFYGDVENKGLRLVPFNAEATGNHFLAADRDACLRLRTQCGAVAWLDDYIISMTRLDEHPQVPSILMKTRGTRVLTLSKCHENYHENMESAMVFFRWIWTINMIYNILLLVGGLEHVLFSISYMGCHPSHWRTPSFFKMAIAPPTSAHNDTEISIYGNHILWIVYRT